MKRIFNTTGTCIPTRHFAADISGKVEQVMEMIARGDYFTINRPRQLCDYLDRQNQTMGYLVIYDLRKEMGKQGEWEKIEKQGKDIYAAWV